MNLWNASWVTFLYLILESCGLESVNYLAPPLVSSAYLTQSTFQQLNATLTPRIYSNVSGFQGYEVYYKIYPISTVTTSTNLANDVNLLSITPTRDYLISLGYQRMNSSNSQATVPPLIRLSSLSQDTNVTLDFASLTGTTPSPTVLQDLPSGPVPSITLGSTANVPVFRTVTNGGTTSYPYFSELFIQPWSKTSDMNSTVISSTTPYEIDLFLVSYAFTLEQTTYSQPSAWGVIQPLLVVRP